MGERISIIIPIYNTEKYLNECVQSVTNQTYKNLEIILVNDGSTDASAAICEKFANNDRRVKYLFQKNKGVTAARKLGLANATGHYVTFVDSDDYIETDLYERLVAILEEKNTQGIPVDFLAFGMKQGYEERECVLGKIPQGDYLTAQEIEYVIDNMMTFEGGESFGINPCMVCKFWNRRILSEVIDKVDDEIFLGEDMVCSYKYILKCQRILVSEICGYHYRMRSGSVVHSVNKRYLKNIDALYNELAEEFGKHSRSTQLMKQLDILMGRMIAKSAFYMGLDKSVGQISYLFPRLDRLAGKRVVLYGAGRVGHGYYALFKKTNICKIVSWVDKNITEENKSNVFSVETIQDEEYDYIVIAVKYKRIAEEIRVQLIDMGVQQEKIIWESPCE